MLTLTVSTFGSKYYLCAPMIKITFPDKAVREYPEGTTAMDIAKSISEGLARNVLSAKVNGKLWGTTRPTTEDSTLELLTWDSPAGKATLLQSSVQPIAEELE